MTPTDNKTAGIPAALAGLLRTEAAPGGATQFGRIYPPRQDWLAKAPKEDILEPKLEIIDTHHHIWDLPNYRYMLEEFAEDIATGHNVVATVFNECRSMYRVSGPNHMAPVGEVDFMSGIAACAESRRYGPAHVAAGIVGFADLTDPRVEETLRAQIVAGNGRFKGVRHAAAWDADPAIGNSHTSPGPGLYRQPDFRKGFERLIDLDLSLDAWVFHPQLDDVLDLAKAYPNANIILCHMGGPLGYGVYGGRQDEIFAAWKKSMQSIAGCENVSVKLGGVMMRLAAYDYLAMDRPPSSAEFAEYWKPYVVTCVELFGAERCMFESNFPVDKMGIGYAGMWNGFKRMVAGASDAEKRALFKDSAVRIYRLDGGSSGQFRAR